MLIKILISGTMTTETGMHIGSGSAFSVIGAVDSPILKDVRTGLPLMSGSSLKGKMRTLLAAQYNETFAQKPDDDCDKIIRLFGSAKKGALKRGRLIFTDAIMSNWDSFQSQGIPFKTEIRFENTISRCTAVANPRQIERTLRGSEFPVELVYEMIWFLEEDYEKCLDELKEDFKTIAKGFELLQYDYLGGNGTRGYGKVKFSDLQAEVVVGELDEENIDAINQLLDTI